MIILSLCAWYPMSFIRSLFSANAAGELAPQEAQRAISDGTPLVDVREPGEFQAGAIPGAINVPLGRIQQQGLQALSDAGVNVAEGDVILVCRSGARSGNACATLQTALGERARNLSGGVMAWARAGLPLTPSGRAV
ncbi:hypothetical protein GCM10028795_19260 [Lysobacter olei]